MPDKLIEVHLDYFGIKVKWELEVFISNDSIKTDFINQKITCLGIGKTMNTNNGSGPYMNEMNGFMKCSKEKRNIQTR